MILCGMIWWNDTINTSKYDIENKEIALFFLYYAIFWKQEA